MRGHGVGWSDIGWRSVVWIHSRSAAAMAEVAWRGGDQALERGCRLRLECSRCDFPSLQVVSSEW